MIKAGIEDPNRKEGIEFCLHCPYPSCIVFEDGRERAARRRDERVAKAKDMKAKGYSDEEIAQVLNVSAISVFRYFRC